MMTLTKCEHRERCGPIKGGELRYFHILRLSLIPLNETFCQVKKQ